MENGNRTDEHPSFHGLGYRGRKGKPYPLPVKTHREMKEKGAFMAKKNNTHRGVFQRQMKGGIRYGIDYIHPMTGQRVRKIVDVGTEADALNLRGIELADARRGAINKAYGLKQKPAAVSFKDMVDLYCKWSKENKKSWKTDEHRAKPLRKAFRGKLMSDLNPFVVEKYKAARVKTVQRATVNKELIFGSQVFQKAGEWKKYNGENPFLKAARFRLMKPKKPGALSPEDVKAIRDQITHPIKRDMVDFDFYTGWRISEVRKLKWEDVDLEKGAAWILDPKNGQTAEIELSDKAIEIIKRQETEKRGPYVFCKKNGDPWKTNLHQAIVKAAERAGVTLPKRKAWHILRRTWASMFLQGGGDVETLRVLGNWKDYNMPMWYAEAGDSERKRKILNSLPDLDKTGANGTEMAPLKKVVNVNFRNPA
jgi:integrase